jgi:hypothetical protein
MLVRVDFMDLGDTLSVLSGTLRGFPAVHVGIRYGDHYLTVPRGETSSWRPADLAERVVRKYVRSSFTIDPPPHDPKLVSLLGEGHVVSSTTWMVATELLYMANDMGLFPCRPRRSTCSRVVATVLSSMGIPVEGDSPPYLWGQLHLLSKTTDYGITQHDAIQGSWIPLPKDHGRLQP